MPLFIAGMILVLSPPLLTLALNPVAAYIVMWAGALSLLVAIFLLLGTGHEE
jgi:hypothetical protein